MVSGIYNFHAGAVGEGSVTIIPNMYAIEKSDTNIVPEKGPNNAGRTQTAAEGSGGKDGDQG